MYTCMYVCMCVYLNAYIYFVCIHICTFRLRRVHTPPQGTRIHTCPCTPPLSQWQTISNVLVRAQVSHMWIFRDPSTRSTAGQTCTGDGHLQQLLSLITLGTVSALLCRFSLRRIPKPYSALNPKPSQQ